MHIRYYLIFVTLIKHTIKKALEVVCMLELFIDKQKFKKHKIRDLVFFFSETKMLLQFVITV